MTWLFILAGTMAIFGVIGYLRGWRAALFILIMTILAAAVTGSLGDTIVKYINAFAKGFRFLLSGGLTALAGGGNTEEAIASLQNAPALVTDTNKYLVLGLIFVTVVLVAILVSGAKWFLPKRSVLGLFIGLIAGYIVAAMIIRGIVPEYAALVPLPFGFLAPTPTGPVVIVPGAGGPSLTTRILNFLNGLVDQGLIAAFLGIVIALFLLLAARSLNRGSRSSGSSGRG
ncbi:MAG: hypothetical protein ACM30E_10425 [Nitrososphaerales archaeon]